MNSAKVDLKLLNEKQLDFNIMIASRCAESLNNLQQQLEPLTTIKLTKKHICNGHSDPLYGLTTLPDLLIFWIGDGWMHELGEIAERSTANRVPMIVISNSDHRETMRMAMKAGTVDYFTAPIDQQELLASTNRIIEEHYQLQQQEDGIITTVMNAKGGAGGSFIAANTAHLMQATFDQKVTLLDLDIQFGNLSSYFNLEPEYGLIDALTCVEELDRTALEGYMTKHGSGLSLLDAKPGSLLIADDIDCQALSSLIELLKKNYQQVVIDLPRHIDLISASILENTNNIVIVMQQNFVHLQDAQRLIGLITQDLEIDRNRITILINRYNKASELSLQDISKSLNTDIKLTIPNAYDQVNESINQGEPLYINHRKAEITHSIQAVGQQLCGHQLQQDRNSFSRLFDYIKGF